MNAADTASISPTETFERLGRITRQLHEALSALGLQEGLVAVTQEIPDARERLTHIGEMTEMAANKVLNLIDEAQPQCDSFKQQSQSMAQAMQTVHTGAGAGAGAESIRDLSATCLMFSAEAVKFAETQRSVLGDIMMTQDFQDLSGQVIKKVIGIISETEQQLLALLMHSAPEHLVANAPKADLAGPQVPNKAMQQDDVDDLLASLGF
jgi:chemotaxis protein CheZ